MCGVILHVPVHPFAYQTSRSIDPLPLLQSTPFNFSLNASQSSTSGNLTILTNTTSFYSQYSSSYTEEDASVQSALDLCRICDLVLFLVDGSSVTSLDSIVSGGGVGGGGSTVGGASVASRGGFGGGGTSVATSIKTSANTAHLDHVISDRGDRILTAIKGQGLPTPVTLVVHKDGEGGGVGGSVMGMGVVGMSDGINLNEDNDNVEEDEDEDVTMSLGQSQHTSKSTKSIRRTYLRRRAELKRYVGRLAVTEFGVDCGKVMEIEVDGSGGGGDGGGMEEDNTATAATSAITTVKSQQTSISALIRTLCTISASGPSWVADASRPYLITDGTAAAATSSTSKGNSSNADASAKPPAVQYNPGNQELKLTGYIRSGKSTTPWNVNQLVHVPHLGTYAVKNIVLAGTAVGNSSNQEELLPPIVAVGRKSRGLKKSDNVDMEDVTSNEGGILLAESNVEERESLEMFASPDALEGEQNLIGFDEDHEFDDDDEDGEGQGDGAAANNKSFQPGTARPAGWSDYQSAWLDALGDTEDGEDHGELAFALNKKKGDATTVGGDDILMDDDDEVNAEDRLALLAQRKRDRQDDLEFPDEVATEEEGAARDRYARYRSLKSFRKSHWDPKENLPETYGAVYHFASFKATQKDVLIDVKEVGDVVLRKGFGCNLIGGVDKDEEDGSMGDDSDDEEDEAIARACVPSGAYVTITLEGVPSSAYARLSPDTILTAVSLLPHENKVSVLHMGLSQSSKCENDAEVPIKSKDVLTFRCGWKTWQGRPIFSQNNLNSDKHKFERFMPTGGAFFACSVFGPVTYAPCPVLMFREAADGGGEKRREMLAHGSMIGADADRIVLKRIILTGYPTRVHKRHATVKYMFYNPEDVKVRVVVCVGYVEFALLFRSDCIPTHLILLPFCETVVPTSRTNDQARTPRKHHRKCG